MASDHLRSLIIVSLAKPTLTRSIQARNQISVRKGIRRQMIWRNVTSRSFTDDSACGGSVAVVVLMVLGLPGGLGTKTRTARSREPAVHADILGSRAHVHRSIVRFEPARFGARARELLAVAGRHLAQFAAQSGLVDAGDAAIVIHDAAVD